jgi:hypothetical protein
MNIRYFPPVSAMAGFGRMITGRVHFRRERVGTIIVSADGEQNRVFREMRVDRAGDVMPESKVTLTLRFRFARFSPRTNQFLSLLPVPVIAGMPGILQKVWTYCDETGYSQGIYLFESKMFAEAYLRSPIVRLLEGRAAEGSFSWEIEAGSQSALTPNANDQEKESASGKKS